MSWEAWFTLGILITMIVGLVRFEHAADVIFLGALALLGLAGVITPREALAGFSNEGMLTVAALFVVAAGLVETGFMSQAARWVLGGEDSSRGALRRVLPLTAGTSAFLNNTTVVAMLMPALLEWSRKRRVAPSRLLLPLSYAALCGGMCTLIGTSTNLVVHGFMQASDLTPLKHGLGMWELAWVGVPIAIAGTAYLLLLAPKLLPDRKEFLEQLGETRREYLAEIIVHPSCPLAGQTVQQAGLRGLPGLFLIEIERESRLISPVGPDERLMAGDRLVFTGVVSTIVDLQKIPGLVPAADSTFEIDGIHRRGRRLCEAVISKSSPLVNRGVREVSFRTIYDAAVIAVHRNGRRVEQKIGDIRLEPGDTLLLNVGAGFARAHRNNPDFFLVSEVGDSAPLRHDRAWIAAGIAAAMVAVLSLPEILSWFPVSEAVPQWFADTRVVFALLAAGLMVVTRCLPSAAARRSIEWNVLLVIAAAFGVGKAMSHSGLADWIARATLDCVPDQWGAIGLLAAVYLLTWMLTELMSNNAAAALMFPIAVAAAGEAQLDPRALVIAVCFAASGGFIFPAGYQTHLMVFGPGGYRIGDFIKAGVPMVLIWMVLALLLIPVFWPLTPVPTHG